MTKRLICLLMALLIVFSLALPASAQEDENPNEFVLTVERIVTGEYCVVRFLLERVAGSDPVGLMDFSISYKDTGFELETDPVVGNFTTLSVDRENKTVRMTVNALEKNLQIQEGKKAILGMLWFDADGTEDRAWNFRQLPGAECAVTNPGYSDTAALQVVYVPPYDAFCAVISTGEDEDGNLTLHARRRDNDERVFCAAYSDEGQMLAFGVLGQAGQDMTVDMTLKCDPDKVDTLKFFCLGSEFEPLFVHIETGLPLETSE